MGMNFNFNSIGSLFGGSSGDSSTWLGDYKSIKNGSYGKLMKAYYSEAKSSALGSAGKSSSTKSGKSVAERIIDENIKRSMRKESAESKAYTAVKSATDKLDSSMDKLSQTGANSLFTQRLITTTDENGVETTEFGYDKEAIYSALSDFVSNYNSLMQAAGNANLNSIINRAVSMQNDTKTNEQALNQLGITINADNTLSINKDNFMKADMRNVENLFSNDKGYTTNLSNSASLIRDDANYAQLRADMYTYDGTYNNSYKNGNSFNSSL